MKQNSQASLAKERCEQNLMNCVEMALFERFQLANTHGFNKIQVFKIGKFIFFN